MVAKQTAEKRTIQSPRRASAAASRPEAGGMVREDSCMGAAFQDRTLRFDPATLFRLTWRTMTLLKMGDTAAGFTLEGIDGQRYALSAGTRETTLLAFFKDSCPTCQLTFPFLQRLFERVDGAPLRFWGLSQDDAERTKAFARQWGIHFPLLPDEPGYPVSNAFGLTNVPTLYLVEPGGKISRSSVGFLKTDLESLASELRQRFRFPGVTPLFVESDAVPELKPG